MSTIVYTQHENCIQKVETSITKEIITTTIINITNFDNISPKFVDLLNIYINIQNNSQNDIIQYIEQHLENLLLLDNNNKLIKYLLNYYENHKLFKKHYEFCKKINNLTSIKLSLLKHSINKENNEEINNEYNEILNTILFK